MTTVLLRPGDAATVTPLGWLDIDCRAVEAETLT